jgi:hypothetical protein
MAIVTKPRDRWNSQVRIAMLIYTDHWQKRAVLNVKKFSIALFLISTSLMLLNINDASEHLMAWIIIY